MKRIRSHIKRFLALIIFISVFYETSEAQRWKLRRYDTGIGIGTAQVFGDIGGAPTSDNLYGLKDIKLDETRVALTTHFRYKINPNLSFKANLNGGMAEATDEGSKNDRGRGYNVKFGELSGQFEYFFVQEDKPFRTAAMYDKRGMLNNFASMAFYGFAGGGMAFSVASHADARVGAEDDYRTSNIVPVAFVGVGARYVLDEKSFIGLELGYRYCFTDYMEGYKQIVSSKHNDVYYLFLISYNYRLKTTRRNLPGFIDRKYSKFGY